MGTMILATILLASLVGMMVYQLGAVLRANRVRIPPLLLAMLFVAIMLAFWRIPQDTQPLTTVFRQGIR